MLSSITPLGERGRGRRWSTTVTAYVVGSALGGAALGRALGALGLLLPGGQGWRAGALAAACVLAAGLDLRGVRPPGPRRQVDERWLTRYRGWVVGAGYGAQLGVGWATIVPTWGLYVVALAAALGGGPSVGVMVGTTFAVARALPVLLAAGISTPALLAVAHRRLAGARAPVRYATIGGHAAAAVVLLTMVGA